MRPFRFIRSMQWVVFGAVTRTAEIFNLSALAVTLYILIHDKTAHTAATMFYSIPPQYSVAIIAMLTAWQSVVIFIQDCGLCLQAKAVLLLACAAMWAMLVGSLVYQEPPIFSAYTGVVITAYTLLCLVCVAASTVVRVYNHTNFEQ